MSLSEIDPPTIKAAGDRLVEAARAPDGATLGVGSPSLDAMGRDDGVAAARGATVESLFLLRDRADHQGRLDLAAYDAYKDME